MLYIPAIVASTIKPLIEFFSFSNIKTGCWGIITFLCTLQCGLEYREEEYDDDVICNGIDDSTHDEQ